MIVETDTSRTARGKLCRITPTMALKLGNTIENRIKRNGLTKVSYDLETSGHHVSLNRKMLEALNPSLFH